MQRRSAAAPPVSPPNSAGPSSHGMVRKRTLQDLQPPSSPNMQSFPHPGSSSSPSIQHSIQFDSSPRNAQLSSPASIYSSPGMARSASAQATFSPFRQTITTSPLGRMCEQDEEVPGGRRPGMKRRRTIAGDSPTSPVKQDNSVSQQLSYTPRCAGKDGEDVWPPDVEEAFHTALALLPRLGRKKLIINGKPCGRNELIGDYILRTTGKARSRKQVSSHIQVLKNLRKDDKDFMELVSEPAEGDDRFAPGNARLFFGDESPYIRPSAFSIGLGLPAIDVTAASSTFTPYPAPAQSPFALHSPFVLHPSHGALTPTTELAHAFQDMSVLPPPIPAACPFSPSDFAMIVPSKRDAQRQEGHVLASLNHRQSGAPLRKILVEDLPHGSKRYPMLPAMLACLPCQFLHFKLNLDIPSLTTASALGTQVAAHVRLDTMQNLPLSVVTTIFCHGDRIIQFVESLAPPVAIGDAASPLGAGRSPSPVMRHKFSYELPFAETYWSHFLSANEEGSASFGRNGKARFELAQNLSMFSVLQEVVVTPDDGLALAQVDDSVEIRGSDFGDVVLVIAYDIEVVEGLHRGTAELSLLSSRHAGAGFAPSEMASVSSFSPQLDAPGMSRSATLPASMAFSQVPAPDMQTSMPPPRLSRRSPPTSSRTHHRRQSSSSNKPNLSLHIPPPSDFVRLSASTAGPSNSQLQPPSNGHLAAPRPPLTPSTPWDQVAHTPDAPPPVLPDSGSAAQRERLEHIWLQNATYEWDLHSPALMGLQEHSYLSSSLSRPASLAPSPIDENGIFSSASSLPVPPALSQQAFPQHLQSQPMYSVHPDHHLYGADFSTGLEDPSLPDLLSVSTSSSSSGSTLSSTQAVEPAPQPRTSAPPPPQVPQSKLKVKQEQDFFSSLLGSTTKYTGVYAS
ncbi:TEA domain family member 1/3/4 [Rhodotorula toruloides NP11]|uniref:TEA domain family member 1/3/4 n=1 Tax=Rhodotorula toruloides (strain NP11) TaxID=1130832 RepID=M7XN77_RHOT1|nr:TEA domain family member 1/3/4 [Rhodotorula toruloides NP11]EMS25364.1 TEA domain family member 1/3/4 [Rhodotorula toruloides NP11]